MKVFLLAILLTIAMPIPIQPVQAHYASWSNVCTYAPDNGRWMRISFKHACHHHDMCYRAKKGLDYCNGRFRTNDAGMYAI